ncbi:hypothetical protein CIK05_01045 [Bdellovibrio sp. qaytius]|nr:hypothetical protein CIK05_01045 [Bdellovibrio sp. qaytius]
MKKHILKISMAVIVLACFGVYTFIDDLVDPPALRTPASYPANYESLKACEKQDILWKKIEETRTKELEPFRKFGFFQFLAMTRQEIALKGAHVSDFAPTGWKKMIHSRGAVAKVKLDITDKYYTGVFAGADCALLRLSLTFKPGGARAVAPGLALKVLRDGAPSANVSALVSIDGQEQDFNFFKNPLTNIVQPGHSMGAKLMHKLFETASPFPEELKVEDMATIDASGVTVASPVVPNRIIFVPNDKLTSASAEHDVREDFLKIPAGTELYEIQLVSPDGKDTKKVGHIVTTSEFTTSEFGDSGIFFRHQFKK